MPEGKVLLYFAGLFYGVETLFYNQKSQRMEILLMFHAVRRLPLNDQLTLAMVSAADVQRKAERLTQPDAFFVLLFATQHQMLDAEVLQCFSVGKSLSN